MSEKIWFVSVNRQQLEGQHSAEEIRELRSEKPDSKFLVWKPGMAQWVDADTIDELKASAPGPKPAAPPPAAPAPSSPAPPPSAPPAAERPAPSPPPSARPEPAPAPAEPPAPRPRPSAPASSPRRAMPSSSGGRDAVMEQAGFFKGLFDFSFTNFVTPKLMKVLYIVVMALIGLFVLLMIGAGLLSIVSAFRFQSFMPALMGLGQIILAPVFGVLYLAFVRMGFEVVMVLFSIKDSAKEMVRTLERQDH